MVSFFPYFNFVLFFRVLKIFQTDTINNRFKIAELLERVELSTGKKISCF